MQTGVRKVSSSSMYSFLVCLFYAFSSTVITLVNKATLTHFAFPHVDILLLCQVILSIISLYLFRWCGWIQFESFNIFMAKEVVLLSFSFVGMVLCGLMALKMNNIPMYSALLRQTTLLVLIQEYFILGIKQPLFSIVTVCVMCFGALIAAWNDLHGSVAGYGMGIVTCFFTSSYTIHMKRVTQTTSLKIFDIMLYNNVLSFPLIFAYTAYSGSFSRIYSFVYLDDPMFQICFFLSASLAFMLNYSVFLCTHVNSPLTTSIVGNLKNLATDLIGLFAFRDVSRTPLYLTGICIATFGGLSYSAFKLASTANVPDRKPVPVVEEDSTDDDEEIAAPVTRTRTNSGGHSRSPFDRFAYARVGESTEIEMKPIIINGGNIPERK